MRPKLQLKREIFGFVARRRRSFADRDSSKTDRTKGWVYVPELDDSLMSGAQVGIVIKNKTRHPPWIVVEHSLASIVISKWPGRLWEVEIIDAVSQADLNAAGASSPLPDANYTRAVAVKIIRELPLTLLFGENGESICKILAAISTLDLSQVAALAMAVKPEAAFLYTRVWNDWLAIASDRSLVTSDSKSSSPVKRGLSVIYQEIYKRASQVGGNSAILVDEDGEAYLNSTWSKANEACLHAAMGYGTRNMLCEREYQILVSAWESIFG